MRLARLLTSRVQNGSAIKVVSSRFPRSDAGGGEALPRVPLCGSLPARARFCKHSDGTRGWTRTLKLHALTFPDDLQGTTYWDDEYALRSQSTIEPNFA